MKTAPDYLLPIEFPYSWWLFRRFEADEQFCKSYLFLAALLPIKLTCKLMSWLLSELRTYCVRDAFESLRDFRTTLSPLPL